MISERIRRSALAAVFAVTTAGATQAAQSLPGTTVNGIAVDPSGAVLPGAQVQLKPPAGGAQLSTNADNTGAFHFDHVAPGRYDLLVTFEGFRPTTVRLTVGTRAI